MKNRRNIFQKLFSNGKQKNVCFPWKTVKNSEKQKTYQKNRKHISKTDSKTAKNSEKQKTEMENCFSWYIDARMGALGFGRAGPWAKAIAKKNSTDSDKQHKLIWQ